MVIATLAHATDMDGWRAQARALLAAQVPPGQVTWTVAGEGGDLFAGMAVPPPSATATATVAVPRAFLDLSGRVIRHRAPERLGLLYRLLWRMTHGERDLLALRVDADLSRAVALARQVQRDAYAMRAFLRFRELSDADGSVYVGWFEPEHHVVELAAPHFVARLGTVRWSILTPLRCAHWDGTRLHYAEGRPAAERPDEDAVAAYWKTYYASTFNPARLNTDAMQSHMPKRYWKNMEETALLPDLVQGAGARADAMVAAAPEPPARKGRVQVRRETIPALGGNATLDEVGAALSQCRDCPLWQHATQAVPGQGAAEAAIMLVGEQPGDQEDLCGRPFAGPAGQVLDRALAEAGLARDTLYITNAVKHFKYEPRGQRRLHRSPDTAEIAACRPWLRRELDLVRPKLVVALGATATRSLLGHDVAVTRLRGQVVAAEGHRILVTFHPAAILRQPDPAGRERQFRALAEDLALARQMAEASDRAGPPPD